MKDIVEAHFTSHLILLKVPVENQKLSCTVGFFPSLYSQTISLLSRLSNNKNSSECTQQPHLIFFFNYLLFFFLITSIIQSTTQESKAQQPLFFFFLNICSDDLLLLPTHWQADYRWIWKCNHAHDFKATIFFTQSQTKLDKILQNTTITFFVVIWS